MVNDKNSYKSFYRTLLAVMLGITMGFFIQHITAYNSRDLANGYQSYANFIVTKMPPILGHLMLLAIFGIAIIFPLLWWLINRKKLKVNIIDALLLVTIGAFPFSIQNCVACIVQILDKEHEGNYWNNLIYVLLYLLAIFVYWRIGRSTCLMKGITEAQNCIIEWFEKRG